MTQIMFAMRKRAPPAGRRGSLWFDLVEVGATVVSSARLGNSASYEQLDVNQLERFHQQPATATCDYVSQIVAAQILTLQK